MSKTDKVSDTKSKRRPFGLSRRDIDVFESYARRFIARLPFDGTVLLCKWLLDTPASADGMKLRRVLKADSACQADIPTIVHPAKSTTRLTFQIIKGELS